MVTAKGSGKWELGLLRFWRDSLPSILSPVIFCVGQRRNRIRYPLQAARSKPSKASSKQASYHTITSHCTTILGKLFIPVKSNTNYLHHEWNLGQIQCYARGTALANQGTYLSHWVHNRWYVRSANRHCLYLSCLTLLTQNNWNLFQISQLMTLYFA